MNAEWGDYDNDGWLDVYVTNITDDYMREGNFLWRNNGDLTFTDVSRETGTYDTGWGWAGKFFDYDNDGWLDLYVVNGWVSAGPESYVPDIFEMIVRPERRSRRTRATGRRWATRASQRLPEEEALPQPGRDQIFTDEAARHGLDSTRDGRGIAVADFDNDGRLDLFVANANAEPFLYRNTASGRRPLGGLRRWKARKSNRDRRGRAAARHRRRPDVAALRRRRQRLRGAEQPPRPFRAGREPDHRLHRDSLALRSETDAQARDGRPDLPDGRRRPETRSIHTGDGDEMTTWLRLAVLCLAAAAADPHRAVVAQAEPVSGAAAYQDAIRAVAGKQYDTALAKFEAALSADPDNLAYGNDYRRAVIQSKQYDRCISFFEGLVAGHPDAANAYLNFGFAYVDKVPDVGAVSQLILASKALPLLSKAVELRPSWLGYATRGNSYMYWPRVFNRTPLAVADLQQAMRIQKADTKRAYHVRIYVSLGDAYWKLDDMTQARAAWRDGLEQFPGHPPLRVRLAATSDDELKSIIENTYRSEQTHRHQRRGVRAEPMIGAAAKAPHTPSVELRF